MKDLVIIAVAVAGLASFLRALPWPKAWLQVKPLGCPVCVSGWSAIFIIAATLALGHIDWRPFDILLAWLACIPGSALVFKQLYPPDIELPLPPES